MLIRRVRVEAAPQQHKLSEAGDRRYEKKVKGKGYE